MLRAMGISVRQFQRMQERLTGAPRAPAQAAALPPPGRWADGRIVLGLDPSLRGTGYGVIQLARPHPRVLSHGTIACPATWPRSRCLAQIWRSVRAVVRRHKPGACAVEGLFYAQNLRTALVMGEARGAALAAVAEAGVAIYELAPRQVKQAIVGYGAARKEAVARMVQRLLALPMPPAPDAADALALALAHAQQARRHPLPPPRRL